MINRTYIRLQLHVSMHASTYDDWDLYTASFACIDAASHPPARKSNRNNEHVVVGVNSFSLSCSSRLRIVFAIVFIVLVVVMGFVFLFVCGCCISLCNLCFSDMTQ